MFFFFLPQGSENKCVEQVLLAGEMAEKGGSRVNMVQKCVHMYVDVKMIPVETIPRIGGGGKFKYNIL
jgi:hypothetical protein